MSIRNEYLNKLSDMLEAKEFKDVLRKNYSDKVLGHIVHDYDLFAEKFADTRYKPETVEKLIELFDAGKLDHYDISELIEDSRSHNRNERYINTFADTVNQENYHDTYAVFRTTNVTDVSFDDMYLGIHQGVYEANDISVVQMNKDLAREMYDLGISLKVCEEYDHYSDLLDFERAYDETSYTFIPPQRHALSSEIQYMRHLPDWSDFKEYLKTKITDMDRLTPYILKQRFTDFKKERALSALADKVAGEYEQYISELKNGDPNTIIKSAYEIYNKDYIVDFCNVNTLYMDLEDIQILLETDNVLDEIYQEWDTMTQLHGFAEIDTAIEDTAYRLKSAKAVKQVMEQKKAELPDVKLETDKPAIKPKKHNRR